MLSRDEVYQFREMVWDYFREHQRAMPWRDDPSTYHVLVSELMLQQTQVGRVLPKYEQFIKRFPTIKDLAEAPLSAVLSEWNGLGYNRRAKFLHASAQTVARDFGGQLPDSVELLITLPGIGKNTAGAILAYAFNSPVVFIETNIRTVFFHHFFVDQTDVSDGDLLPLVEQTRDLEHPREWYWALMDYGAFLKQTVGNNIAKSKHYARQSTFKGSRRQLRGQVIRYLITASATPRELAKRVSDERLDSIIEDLVREGLVERTKDKVRLTGQVKLP